jgi:hypothetical protein
MYTKKYHHLFSTRTNWSQNIAPANSAERSMKHQTASNEPLQRHRWQPHFQHALSPSTVNHPQNTYSVEQSTHPNLLRSTHHREQQHCNRSSWRNHISHGYPNVFRFCYQFHTIVFSALCIITCVEKNKRACTYHPLQYYIWFAPFGVRGDH